MKVNGTAVTKNSKLPEKYQGRADFLYNLQLLEGGENQIKKDKDPESWLQDCFSSDDKKIKAYKATNYIDEDLLLDWESIETFEAKRSEKIKSKLKKILLG